MDTDYRSPLLDLPDAVAGDGIDAPVAAHYGSFNNEQRTLDAGDGSSTSRIVRLSGSPAPSGSRGRTP